MNGQIIQTSLAAVTVPQGGIIRETVFWTGTVPTGPNFLFSIASTYGDDIDGTLTNFSGAFGTTAGHIGEGNTTFNAITNVDKTIPSGAEIRTYDCLTMVGYIDTEAGQFVAFHFRIDQSILTVESGLGATITSIPTWIKV